MFLPKWKSLFSYVTGSFLGHVTVRLGTLVSRKVLVSSNWAIELWLVSMQSIWQSRLRSFTVVWCSIARAHVVLECVFLSITETLQIKLVSGLHVCFCSSVKLMIFSPATAMYDGEFTTTHVLLRYRKSVAWTLNSFQSFPMVLIGTCMVISIRWTLNMQSTIWKVEKNWACIICIHNE